MKKIEVEKHLNLDELRSILNKEQDIRLFRYWYLLYYISTVKGLKAEDYSNRLALGKYNIYRIVQLYNKTGKDFVNNLQWGGRRKLSTQCEKEIVRKLKRNGNLTKDTLIKAVQKQFESKLPAKYIDELIERYKLILKRVPRKFTNTSNPRPKKSSIKKL